MSKANVGDLIRVVEAVETVGSYEKGDILEVTGWWANGKGVYAKNSTLDNAELYHSEYAIFRKFDEESTNLNGKLLRIYTGTDVEGDFKTEVTVGIDEATGVMYVLGIKTEVVE